MAEERKREFPWAFAVGLGIVGLLILIVIGFSGGGDKNKQVEKLPFDTEEQAYAKQIRFEELKVSRAANFLNQEVTYLFGLVTNGGSESIQALEIELVFQDPYSQIVLREPRRLVGRSTAPLGAGGTREFQISFDHVPADWNQAVPGIRVTGLRLE